MAFWVVKARPRETNLEQAIVPDGRRSLWRTKRPPKAWKPTDGVFLWQGAPTLRLTGIGTITDIPDRKRSGLANFEVEYVERFDSGPSLDELRKVRALGDASFLKSGAAGTVFPLKAKEAAALAARLRRQSESIEDWYEQVVDADTPEMAISIRQPYVELILRGDKTSEYRTQPTKRRGRVYLYASKNPGVDAFWKKAGCEPGSLPVGVMIGTVDIMTCVEDAKYGYAFRLANPVRFDEPVAPEGQPQPTWFRPFGRGSEK